MRYFSILLIFISSSFITFPSYTSSGNYIVYETGLVVPSGSENITFNFTGIDIENEIEEMVEFRENLFNSKMLKTITLEDFYNLLIALEQLYVLNGYFLTRFIVPPQTIEPNSRIQAIVFPGKIESVDYSQLDKRITKPIKNYFNKLVGIKGLEYPIIEKSIIKSRELPGVELETTIKAGKEPGTSSLQLNAEHELVSGYFTYSNGLSETAGKDQFTSYFSLNSPFGYGENIYAAYIADPKNNAHVPIDRKDIINRTEFREAYLVGGKIPVLSSDFSLFGAVNESYSQPDGLDKRGEFKQINVGVEYQLKNTRLVKNNISLDWQWIKERDYSTLSFITEDTFYDKYNALQLKYTTTNLSFLDSLSLKGSSSLKFGTPIFTNTTSDTKTLSRVGSTLNFIKWNSDINLNKPILRDYSLNARLVFQKLISDRGLINSEQINITGPGQMSGFESGNLSGDQGFFIRTELSRAFYPFVEGEDDKKEDSIRIMPYLHLGIGASYYKRPASGELSRTEVVSGGYGIKVKIPLDSNSLDISFEVAEADKSVKGTTSRPVYLLNTTFSF
jgi:hemolysin activation/secretion protein